MKLSLRTLKLKTRMVLVLGLIALLQTGLIGWFALYYLNQSLAEQIGQRAVHVAQTLADMPEVISAVMARNTDYLQPLSVSVARATDAHFVVIGDRAGIRLSHPNPSRLGKPMHDDEGDYNEPALLYGQPYIQMAVGSLGASVRGKAPVFSESGEVIVGVISVGFMLDTVEAIIDRYRNTLLLVILAAFLFSVLTAIWFANHFKRAIFGLEPEQIARLFDEQRATLESVREGIIAINSEGEITTINHTAIEALGLPKDSQLIGRKVDEVLPDNSLLDVLRTGEPQYDREVWRDEHCIIANRLPLKQGDQITGVVSSFRRKDELAMVSQKLTRIQQYADTLRSQSHEYSNKLHTIAGLIQIGATDQALALIGQESQSHQELIRLLMRAVPDPVLAGCLLGKFNRARELGLRLAIDPESEMSQLPDHLPREQLVSIIGNLIDNALEATWQHKGQDGVVQLSMTDLGDDLIFEVEDQGPGIPEAQREQIFEKGFSSKKHEGHGYGLHLVKGLLNKLGGTLTIESVSDMAENPPAGAIQGGSRFTVYIPKNKN